MTRNNTTTLDRALRGRLENAVKEARETAEAAARAALEHLCAGGSSPPPHLSEHERGLRRRLRAHGRQLGDARDPIAETQEINCLIEEAAYEHWHRMLFTRFLAENNLLIYPDPENPVSVTLEECGEMAQEEGAANGWELASRFASQMLPQIFRLDSPVFQLALPPEFQQKLERLIAELPAEVFTASDSLGWVYQFWQSKRKDEVNKSEVKIGAKELPAVTQLFTEPYMVSFLLDNSIGAWWATRRLSPDDLRNALSEDELRNKASVAGVPLEYIRFVKQDNGSWRPAAGDFENWPENPGELKILDPCCGSGHFLISALLMLVPMRMQIEGLSARNAVDAVLRENLHGLEIDRRCVEIAAFNLALAAWRYPGAGGYRNLPELNIACSGLAVSARKEEWMSLAGDDIALRGSLSKLHDMFRDAPILGSLINPHKIVSELFVADYAKTAEILKRAVGREQSDESKEAGIAAQGIAKAASLLADKYHLIITNVPYLARGKQCAGLSAFCEKNHYEAKGDLATVFLDRCLDFCVNDNGCQGTLSLVLPQNWLFLTTYKRFRERLLRDERWRMVARLGEGGFESTAAAGAFTILLLMSLESESYYKRISEKSAQPRLLSGLDASAPRIPAEKAELLRTGEIKLLEQERQLDNPDARVVLEEGERYELLEKYASAYQGISPADFPRFGRFFWENIILSPYWSFWQSSVENIVHYGGKELIIWLSEVNKKVETEGTAYIRGSETWGKKSIVVSAMRELPVTIGEGTPSDTNVAIMLPHSPSHLPAIWCFCSSPEYNEAVRKIDQKLNVTNATLVKVPFDLERWQRVAEEKYPNGLPRPYSDDPTQWIFHGHPCGSVIRDEDKKILVNGALRTDSTVLQIAVARLLGYRWPAELDENMELDALQREWVGRCDSLLRFADEDGIVCIPPVRGEQPAADRLLNLLAASYGSGWSADILNRLLASSDHAGKTIETWLREKFFSQHCKLFHHRPFVWHIWDGLNDGFAALVNYHKLDRKNMETLIYTYLGDWIARQRQDIEKGVDGAVERLAAAETLKKRLESILEGEKPYDIFVRWKPIERQPIGWEPDLNDGVRLNIRPFLTVPDVGKRGAGVLRDRPNIAWNKDRGKDIESAPWHHIFKGDRINDHHLSLEEKRNARRINNNNIAQ